MGILLAGPAVATPISFTYSGVFDSAGYQGSSLFGGIGDPFSVQVDFDTDSISYSSFNHPGYADFAEYYVQDSHWSGTIGTTNFDWTGTGYLGIENGFGPGSEDHLHVQPLDYAQMIDPSIWTYMFIRATAGPNTFADTDPTLFNGFAGLTQSQLFYLEDWDHYPVNGFAMGVSSSYVVPEPTLAALLYSL